MPRSFLVKKKRGASGGWRWKEPEQLEWKDDDVIGTISSEYMKDACFLCTQPVKYLVFSSLLLFSFSLFLLLERGNAEEHGVQQPAPAPQPGAPLACVRASLRVPVLLAGAGKSGPSCRSDWSTVTLREYSYHSSTLALSRAKVKSLFVFLRLRIEAIVSKHSQ